jgi:hypothetical protein
MTDSPVVKMHDDLLIGEDPVRPKHHSGQTSKIYTAEHDICDGAAKLFRTRQSGNVWQMQCWINAEERYMKKSLRTRDLEQANEKGRKLYYAMMGTASRWSPACISAGTRNTRTSAWPIHAVQCH